MFEKIIYISQLDGMIRAVEQYPHDKILIAYLPMIDRNLYFLAVGVGESEILNIDEVFNDVLHATKDMLNTNVVFASEFEVLSKKETIRLLKGVLEELLIEIEEDDNGFDD